MKVVSINRPAETSFVAMAEKQRQGLCLVNLCECRAESGSSICRVHWLALSPRCRREIIRATENLTATSKPTEQIRGVFRDAWLRAVQSLNVAHDIAEPVFQAAQAVSARNATQDN